MDFLKAATKVISSPVVQNDLISLEQAAYYYAIHDLMGDKNRILYNGIGPDITTPLLISNAQKIYGVDVRTPAKEEFKEFTLKNVFPLLDKRSFPGLSAPCYSRENTTPIEYFIQEDIRDYVGWHLPLTKRLYEDLEHHRYYGYWDLGDINRWGQERLLAIELKRLGVKSESIQIFSKEDQLLKVSFEWAYPGEKKKTRTVTYTNPENIGKIPLRKLNGFLQKSIPKSENTDFCLKKIRPFLKKNISIYMGYCLNNEHKDSKQELFINEILDSFKNHKVKKINKEFMDHLDERSKTDKYEEKEFFDYTSKIHLFDYKN